MLDFIYSLHHKELITYNMKLHILLFIMVTKTACKAVADGAANLDDEKGASRNIDADDVDVNSRALQFGERLSGKKAQIPANRHTTKEAHSDQNKAEDIRNKRGHNQRNNRISTSHFVIGGHSDSISGGHNLYSHPSLGNPHEVVIPVLGVESGQASSGPFINYGSATLTRTGPRRHPTGTTSRKHFNVGNNHHKAGIKDPETIKHLISNGGYSATSLSTMKTIDSDVLRNLLGDGYHKNGPYSHSDGYSPGTGYYYG